MKENRIRRFNENSELNISDVMSSVIQKIETEISNSMRENRKMKFLYESNFLTIVENMMRIKKAIFKKVK
jgi:hypothetical protein